MSNTNSGTVVRRGDHPDPDATREEPVVPGFELLARLNAGGMGVVYQARQEALNRVVALKLIAPAALAGRDARERFEREAKAAARLNHPNVVALLHTELAAPTIRLVSSVMPRRLELESQ